MNPLWLLLIVPGVFCAGFCFSALFQNSDAERARLIDRQYRELRAASHYNTALMLTRHDREREELEG